MWYPTDQFFLLIRVDNQIGICLLELGEYEQAEVVYNKILEQLRGINGGEESHFATKIHLNLDLVCKRKRKNMDHVI